jgi:hypothetical protein
MALKSVKNKEQKKAAERRVDMNGGVSRPLRLPKAVDLRNVEANFAEHIDPDLEIDAFDINAGIKKYLA